MIEQLKSAGDQLRAAWDNYCRVYSGILNYPVLSTPSHAHKFPPELIHQLDIEIAFIQGYEPKIQEIRIGISRAHNYWSGLAPINTLSPDILTRIFHFARPQPCRFHYLNSPKLHERRFPDHLARVCTLWCNIAISSRSLWSHIDIFPCGPNYNRLITRAETHAERATDKLIELHIAQGVTGRPDRTNRGYYDLYELISRISSRVESLEFAVSSNFQGFHRSVLSRLLLSQPPTLRELIIHSSYDHSDAFIYAEEFDPDDSDEEFEDFRLNLTEDQVESGFALLTVLHLNGIFPLWSSVAYHRLVDLRLFSTDSWSSIEEEELTNILTSSPGLQILHFGLEIQLLTADSTEVTPVYLQDLQIVKIFPYKAATTLLCPSKVLRLLAPGSKLLRLSFDNYYEPDDEFIIDFEAFFARSRVVGFYTRSAFPPISALLRHAIHLEQIILEDYESVAFGTPHFTWLEVDSLVSWPRLRSLYVTTSALSESELRLFVKCCPTGVTLYACDVDLDSSEESMSEELSDIFPTVTITDTPLCPQGDPPAEWDVLI
ncbi:unnamed protein product [Rhizoctonia solani]|uniref:F-box domain-containing protein n=1 Tax=Rhizoctonia solani TaxID=456999 RepID=A0A8H2XPN3_9AGAM|nr:unnamed protein product [Rhizoctonia solani]